MISKLEWCSKPTDMSVEVREDLKPQNLSFTEIAKRVGECWQVLGPNEKDLYDSQASLAKEKYNVELSKYKKTPQYQDYALYLAEFKVKNAPSDAGKVFLHVAYLITSPDRCSGRQAKTL